MKNTTVLPNNTRSCNHGLVKPIPLMGTLQKRLINFIYKSLSSPNLVVNLNSHLSISNLKSITDNTIIVIDVIAN